MSDKWLILGVLTLARAAMGVQFQSIATAAPYIVANLDITYAALGTLVGIYLLPGMGVAIPGGWLGQAFGDKRVVLIGLACMVVGGLMTAVEAGYLVMLAGRTLAGLGAVLLNVLVAKMVTDWFEDDEIVTAMGILIVSWPLGIAVAMVGLGPLADWMSWPAAMIATAAVSGFALLIVLAFYRPPPRARATAPATLKIGLSRRELGLTVWAGLTWTFYNLGFILVLGFAPDTLNELGYQPSESSALVSLVSWTIIPALPLGAFIAARIGRPDLTLHLCLLAAGAAIFAIPAWGASALLFVMIGLLLGPPGGLIMGLPSLVLRPENRAFGMGIFFTCYYVGMGVGPTLAGLCRDLTGNPAAPLYFAASMLGLAMASLVAFRVGQARR